MPKVTKPNLAKKPVVATRNYPFRRGSAYYIKFPQEDGTFKELELPSVTTILSGTSDKQMLINWAGKQAATIALANPSMSVDEVTQALYQKKTGAIDIGKTIHKFAEDHSKGLDIKIGDLDPTLQPYGQAFLDFIDLHKPRILFNEVCVFNATHGYAGTADLIAIMSNGKTAILDWKTGKGTYWDNHLQQIAYAHAEWIYTENKNGDMEVIKMPEIHQEYLVHLKPNGTSDLIRVKESPENLTFDDFLISLKFYPTAKKRSAWT